LCNLNGRDSSGRIIFQVEGEINSPRILRLFDVLIFGGAAQARDGRRALVIIRDVGGGNLLPRQFQRTVELDIDR